MAAYHGGNGGDKAATESNMSLEEDGKKNKKIAYRARKTHKLRECQMKKNQKAGYKKWQSLQNADTDTKTASDLWQEAGRHPMDSALLLLPRVAYSLSTLFVACHVWQRSCHFAFNTRESLNYTIRFACPQSGA